MSKSKKAVQPASDEKGFIALAGEAFSVLGHEIMEGKDKVVEVASEKFTAVKKAIKKITHKKAAPKKKVAPAKKKAVVVKKAVAAKKVAPKKAVKKAAKKVAKKAVKKAAPGKKKK
jgi:hypothetical protein